MRVLWLLLLLLVASGPLCAAGEEFQFPPPEFSQSYHYPHMLRPGPRASWLGYVDVGVLALTLGLAAHLALRKRRRRDLAALAVFSLLYFGLYRQGCVCSVGALQNVAAAATGVGLGLPAVAAVFFVLPLLFALAFGRVFCSAVCPLGAAQEVVLLRPVRVPAWLETTLGTLPYLYLGAAVLFAATGSAFVICDYDPFIAFFRLAGRTPMLIFGICLLATATVIGRPYCRYLCPYGVLLRLLAPFARWQVRITPHQCINCHLCADACPYGAIRAPTPEPGTVTRRAGRGQLGALLLLLPVLVAVGGQLASLSRPVLARVHPQVRLANRLWLEEQGRVQGKTPLTEAFELQGLASSDAYREAAKVHRRFGAGSWLFGGWLGLVLGLKMIGQSIRRHRPEYEVDAGGCVACGRCYAACPIEHAGAPVPAALNVDQPS
jgi:ferredoxin